jgi:hypothetical protein
MRRFVLWGALAFSLGVLAPPHVFAAVSPTTQVVSRPLNKPGEKVPLDADHYFTYGFDKTPKIGTAIMRVEVFTRDGKRDTSYTVKGDADMPSMRGAHAAGAKDFSLSAKGVYLLPVRLVMPGDWEISFTFVKTGKTVFRGTYVFDL